MKKINIFLFLLFFSLNIFAQKISGTVSNQGNEKLSGAIIKIKKTFLTTNSDRNGSFEFNNLKSGKYNIEVSYIGYKTETKQIILDKKDFNVNFVLEISEVIADEVIITATRANQNTPVAFTNIEKESIDRNNNGQDIPYLLELTPSVVISSDAGAGIGYTSMRIRGSDMTRINITLDGIPLNDSESHGVWWVNMPDFASSIDNIQIQRGVGTSSNGAGAFGANVNFVSEKIKKKAYADINWTLGSFNTKKATYKVGTGLLGNHFVFDARLSKISSDGFIDRARSNLQSYYVSGKYIDKKNFFKINIFKGTEETYQAWNGVPKASLDTNRTYNSYTYENEVDHYTQKHYQMFYTHEFNEKINFNIALHHTKGEGYYEQSKSDRKFKDYGLDTIFVGTDTIAKTNLIQRKWLKNNFYGVVYSLKYSKHKLNVVLGGAWNKYDGDHFGKIIWAKYSSNGSKGHEWYNNNGIKTDLNEYLKINYQIIQKLNFWADLQYRIINYKMDGTHDDLRDISQKHNYNFFNPKAGFTYEIANNQTSYFSFAIANREPSRSNFRDAAENEIFIPETLYDYEGGYKFTTNNFALNLNLYYMDYKNQLILTGEINDVGAYIMSNVRESYRAGAELSGGIKIFDLAEWKFNATYSQNKIKNLTVYIDNWDTWGQETEAYKETDISFSPDIIASSELSFNILEGFDASFISKYVGRQYIDNTSNIERSLNPYFVNNLRLSYSLKLKKIKEINFSLTVNNIFNEKYETNAWVYRYTNSGKEYAMDGYFPQAGTNFLGGVSFRF